MGVDSAADFSSHSDTCSMIKSVAKRHFAIYLPLELIGLVIFFGLLACVSHPSSSPPPTPPPGYPEPYKIGHQWYQPVPHSKGFQQKGLASWYGKKFHGRRTANGEIYDMYGISAAHKTLPFGTWVRVHNLANGRRLDVRINDRGPFIQGRIIDLSYGAAKKIGLVGPGTAPVKIVALGILDRTTASDKSRHAYQQMDYDKGNFTVQVGAYRERKNAEHQRLQLARMYKDVRIQILDKGDGVPYKVRVGRFNTLDAAREYKATLVRDGYPNAFAVAE